MFVTADRFGKTEEQKSLKLLRFFKERFPELGQQRLKQLAFLFELLGDVEDERQRVGAEPVGQFADSHHKERQQ